VNVNVNADVSGGQDFRYGDDDDLCLVSAGV